MRMLRNERQRPDNRRDGYPQMNSFLCSVCLLIYISNFLYFLFDNFVNLRRAFDFKLKFGYWIFPFSIRCCFCWNIARQCFLLVMFTLLKQVITFRKFCILKYFWFWSYYNSFICTHRLNGILNLFKKCNENKNFVIQVNKLVLF